MAVRKKSGCHENNMIIELTNLFYRHGKFLYRSEIISFHTTVCTLGAGSETEEIWTVADRRELVRISSTSVEAVRVTGSDSEDVTEII